MKKIFICFLFLHSSDDLSAQRYILFFFQEGKPWAYDTALQKKAYQGDFYYHGGKYDSSVFFYRQLYATHPEKYELLYNMAVSYAALGKNREAVFFLRKYLDKAVENCHCSFISDNPHFTRLKNNKKYSDLVRKCTRQKAARADKQEFSNPVLEDRIQFYLGKDQEILSSPRFSDNQNKMEKDSLLQDNLKRLLSEMDTNNLPGKEEIGLSGTGALHILFLHADYWPGVQNSIGKKMMEMGDQRGYSRKNAAYLIDRSLRNSGLPQLYGTILVQGVGGRRELYPVDDPDKVKERRLALGFQPIEEYLKNYSITK